MIDRDGNAGRETYAGLFAVTLATLMYEILLTRIFSVTMWYHYAFLAVSIALFGMTVGAILVYLFPLYFAQDRAKHHLALSAWLFSVSTIISFLTYASIPFAPGQTLVAACSVALTYVVISIPFVFSGICVSLALTRFPQQVSRLYAMDLAGAACGCILILYTLRITDGPGAVIVVASLAGVGAALLSAATGVGRLRRVSIVSCALLALFAGTHAFMVAKQHPVFRLLWVNGSIEPRALYEKWNTFSRVRIDGNPNTLQPPFGWGFSGRLPSDVRTKGLVLAIDQTAATPLIGYRGDLGSLGYLKYDITNLAHYLRHDARVFVIGSGGGRDALSALVFGQRSVVAVELNRDIITAVNRRFGDFTGHLDRDPRVIFINDEARSYLARQRADFDIIQASLIDTWAATAAGAFVLSENSLYTVEAWKLFLERLSPNGLLTFSRWYSRSRPAEMYRLTALASASLKKVGVEDPRGHIIIARHISPASGGNDPDGVGTLLVSRRPFSADDLRTVGDVAGKMGFDLMLTPKAAADSMLARLATGKHLKTVAASFPLNIAPPTDASPFFFHMLRLRDIFKPSAWELGSQAHNSQAVYVLGVLLLIVIGLTLACIIAPLSLTTKKGALRGTWPFFVFFASIGFGFMFVEMSQMQRLIIFLGHPTYGLTVVLFSLLLSSGIGSQLTQGVSGHRLTVTALSRFGLLLCALIVFGTLTPYAVGNLEGAVTPVRILAATAMLFPIGVLMGMAFPLGMRVASSSAQAVTPWLWGINGATSVCASVLAIVVALSTSISTSFWTGVGCYGVAAFAFLLMASKERASEARRAPSLTLDTTRPLWIGPRRSTPFSRS